MPSLVVLPSLVLPEASMTWAASRSSGAGGQNVNKVSSKVELRFDFESCGALDEATKSRLRTIAATRLDADGRILVVSQKTRDQPKNLEDAREKLKALVLKALERPKKRRPTRPSRGAVERRLSDKNRASRKKRERSGSGGD